MPLVRASRGQVYCSPIAWMALLKLAYTHGWRPTGTFDSIRGWLDETFWSQGWSPDNIAPAPNASGDGPLIAKRRFVPAHDAASLADALERALPDIPDHDALEHRTAWWIDLPGHAPIRTLLKEGSVSPYEFFSGHNRRPLLTLVHLCRSGGGLVIT